MVETSARTGSQSRRTVLQVIAGGVAGVTPGCSDVIRFGPTDGADGIDDRIDGSWGMQHADSGNTRATDADGMEQEPSRSWSTSIPGLVQGEPMVAGGVVYVPTFSGRLVGFEAATGETYTTMTVSAIVAPSIVDDAVYGQLPGDSQPGPFGALEPSTKRRRWDHAVEGVVTSPIHSNGTVYASAFDADVVYAFDADAGSLEWRFETVGRPKPVAIVDDDRLVFTTGRYLIAVDAASGERTWDVLEYEAEPSTPRSAAERIVLSAGTEVVALARDGSPLWSAQPFDTDPGPMALAHDEVYVGSAGGVAALAGGTGEPRWRAATVPAQRSIVATEEVLYAAGEQTLTVLDRATGDANWSKRFDERIRGVSAGPGWLFVLTTDAAGADTGTLHAFVRQ